MSSLEELNDELHTAEILCRVPLRQLMRCKCVSKRWLSLISSPDPHFVARHRFFFAKKQGPWTRMCRSTNSKKMLIPASNDPVFQSEGFSLNFLPCYQPTAKKVPIHILSIVGDLFLCCASNVDRDEDVVYYLCNPLTTQWVALPPTRNDCDRRLVHLVCEFDELEGLMTTLSRFKVVRFLLNLVSFPRAVHMDIYSSETGQWMWRKLVLDPSKPFNTHAAHKTLIRDGTVCCLSDPRGSVWKIMLFNLISVINSPNDDEHHHHHDVVETPNAEELLTVSVIAYQKCFRAVGLVISPTVDLYIWELKENLSVAVTAVTTGGDKWSLVHRVSLTEMVPRTVKEWFYEIVDQKLPRHRTLRSYELLDSQPCNENNLFLCFYGLLASYNMRSKVLTFHHAANPEAKPTSTKAFYLVVLPSRPTVIPNL